MKAKKKPLERLSVEDLELADVDVTVRTSVQDQYLPPKKQAGQILEGEIDQQVHELFQLLRNEAKVI